ncbi:alpha-galactosidase A [Hypoxylon argillaceum]|nr:alpha-galactosidase A [Hypoxylon argillaceum]
MAVSTGPIEVLSQEISDEEGMYRIRSGQQVYYLTISTDVFDEDTMCRPYLLFLQLPSLLDMLSKKIQLTRNENGSLTLTAYHDPLQEITFIWHEKRIDVLSLPLIKRFRSGIFETLYEGRAAAYYVLTETQRPSGGPLIAPEFLGHLTENGRVIGFLIEKLEGRVACLDNLTQCAALLKRLHGLGLVHGDVNRYNFIVEECCRGCVVRLVDLEHAQDYDEKLAHAELESLPAELAEETGRGSSITRLIPDVDEADQDVNDTKYTGEAPVPAPV